MEGKHTKTPFEVRNAVLVREVLADLHAKARAEGRHEDAGLLLSCYEDPDIVNAYGYATCVVHINLRDLVTAKIGPSLTSIVLKPRRATLSKAGAA